MDQAIGNSAWWIWEGCATNEKETTCVSGNT